MKVTIYFGHHKVGSTALQSFLFRNQITLTRAGILYPGVESESLSYMAARLLEHTPLPSGLRSRVAKASKGAPPMNAREPHNALAFRMLAQANNGTPPPWHEGLPGVGQMVRAMQMQAHFLQPETVVLCSEVMANFGPRHPDMIDKVRDIFPEAEQSLYCVLRRPDEYLVAWHAQRMRFGDKVRALSDGAANHYTKTIHFNYQSVIAPWVDRFPGAPLHIRNYADVLASGGSVEDFFGTTGLTLPQGLKTSLRANESLPRAAMEIARRANHDLPALEADEMRHYLLTSKKHITPLPNREIEMFGASLRAELAEKFAPIHAYLSELTGKDAFFPDIDEMIKPLPIPESEAVADFLSKIPLDSLPNDRLRDFIQGLAREYAATA